MKTISEIYDEYNIIPNLREHMLRVAGVAAWVCDHMSEEVQKQLHRDEIISACLLHDMGNIIKFDFSGTEDLFPGVDVAYWLQVQKDFIHRYGPSEHHAHLLIVRELGMTELTLALINSIGFSYLPEVLASTDLSKKICAYADTRVAPQGVATLVERFQDWEKRYRGRLDEKTFSQEEIGKERAYELEKELGALLNVPFSELTSASVAPYCEKFLDFTPV